ncbi:MAG: LolA family protein [Planctomycetota bacterium]
MFFFIPSWLSTFILSTTLLMQHGTVAVNSEPAESTDSAAAQTNVSVDAALPSSVAGIGDTQAAKTDNGAAAIDDADDLLRALEAADRDLRSFTASIRFTKEQGLIGDVQVRRGRVLSMRDSETKRQMFAVKFDRQILGDAVYERSQDFIFDGIWLVERNNEEKSFVKRQIVDVNDESGFDPFAIDGPFPLPIGQNRETVLRRFHAELLPSPREGRLQDTWHLQLIPRNPEAEEENFEQIDLWYDRETLLPLKGVLVESEGDEISTVELASIARNAAVEPSVFDTNPPTIQERRNEGWSVSIVPLPPREERDDAATPSEGSEQPSGS